VARSEFLTLGGSTTIGSVLPLYRWPLPRLCGLSAAGCTDHLSAASRVLSSSFTSLQSIIQRILASLPQPASSSLGLSFPTAHEVSKVHSLRVLPARFVPPSGFGYPLDGFLPSKPCRFYFTPAALLGFSLRSFPLSQGIRDVSARKHPPTVPPAVTPPPKRRPARRAAVPGL
jgi:hypothetical protein